MSDNTAVFFTDLKRELHQLWQDLSYNTQRFAVGLRNQIRLLQRAELDYIILPIGGPLPERADPPRSFIQRQLPLPAPPLPMEAVNHRLQAIGDAANVKGVLFIFRGFSAGLATLQNLRRSIERLQAAGKEVIVYTPYLDVAHYFVAAAADRIIAPPGARFEVLGLRSEAIFLKETLARIGVAAEVIQISPFKTAYNMLGEADITPEHRAQLEWLLDDTFDLLTQAMAGGRGKSVTEIRDLIDGAPYTAVQARDLGLIDDVAYEDELEEKLAPEQELELELEEKSGSADGSFVKEEAGEPPAVPKEGKKKAKLLTWGKAHPMLLEKARKWPDKFIGVVSLEGLITMGPSRQPPLIPLPFLDGATAGEATLVNLLRRAEKIDEMAALILHVDSGGGSALASELITREIERIGRKKPVLAYMGNTAASGGYEVSVLARHIMCQPVTITGSIGVIMMRPDTQALYEKLSVKRVSIKRGERADLYSDDGPLSDDERETLWRGVVETYETFKQLVANGRSLAYDDLDPICEGRVWTGRQALGHKLVDSHGDFEDAIRRAAELADLPTGPDDGIPVANLYPKSDGHRPPRPFETEDGAAPAAAIAELSRWLSGERLRELSGQPLLLLPYEIKFR
ncbi:MAG: signal peptide peptidase SppA [Anaerolineae bacterium]